MRIISGEYRGRRLISPATYDIRPTSDKVKEAVFNLLIPYISEGFAALDLFSGTGSLGLEAVSRGAARVYFSDSSRESIKIIKENIKLCAAEEHSVILSGDYRSNIRRIHDRLDIVFIDPPYAGDFYIPALREIKVAGILKEGGCIVCEHSAREALPDEAEGFRLVKCRRYGQTGVSIYE